MNASAIITDDMTLEEKLSAIDAAMKAAQEAAEEQAAKSGTVVAPFDPALATLCDGCEEYILRSIKRAVGYPLFLIYANSIIINPRRAY